MTFTDERGTVGLSGVAGVLAPATQSLAELASAGLVTSPVTTLAGFGFERVRRRTWPSTRRERR